MKILWQESDFSYHPGDNYTCGWYLRRKLCVTSHGSFIFQKEWKRVAGYFERIFRKSDFDCVLETDSYRVEREDALDKLMECGVDADRADAIVNSVEQGK